MTLPSLMLVSLLGVRLTSALLQKRGAGLTTDDAIPDDVISAFWEGLDVRNATNRLILQDAEKVQVTPQRQQERKRSPSLTRQVNLKLALLGPFDTGTHLLLNTLQANYHDEVVKACGWESMVIDDDPTSHCRLWKHGINISDSRYDQGGQPVYQILRRQSIRKADTVVVMLVRSPLATMISWWKAAYNLAPCVDRGMEQYSMPCTANGMAWEGAGQPDWFSLLPFTSTMDVYNTYIRMYGALQEEGRLHAALLVTYEDLVYSPGDVINAIADAMGWPPRASVGIADTAAKSHGWAHGRSLALEKLRSRDWLQHIPSEVRKAMCTGLELRALEGLRDNNYRSDEPSETYDADCKGYL